MTGKDAVKSVLRSTESIMDMYLGDLSDAEILERPAPSANHIAWQLGHLIKSEIELVKSQVSSAVYPELPAGFAERHTKEASRVDPPKGFAGKTEYLNLFKKVRGATIATLDKLSDADLDKPTTGQMAPFAPRLGDFFILVSNHVLMHAGQFTALRRKLGKPVLF